jgi:hypothetical protein
MAAHDSTRRGKSDVLEPAPPPSGARPIGAFTRHDSAVIPRVSPRAIIDTIIQSSAVELFQAHGITVAPIGSMPVGTQQRFHDNVAMIGFEGRAFVGTLTLSIPSDMLATRTGPGTDTAWGEELINQLHGRVKNRLAVFQVPLKSSLPRTMGGATLESLRRRSPTEVLYRFRAMQGDVIVTLDAPVHEVLLAYSGAAQIVREGDVVLF